jgi:hypothetical protein
MFASGYPGFLVAEVSRAQDTDSLKAAHDKQVVVSGDQVVGVAVDCQRQQVIVRGIAAELYLCNRLHEPARIPERSAEASQVMLLPPELPQQDPLYFGNQRRRGQELNAANLAEDHNLTRHSAEYECRDIDVAIANRRDHARLFLRRCSDCFGEPSSTRDSLMSRTTSASVIPSSLAFARP